MSQLLRHRCVASLRQVTACAVALACTAPAWAQSARVVSVEEHWELRLGNPDPDRSAPQTTMVQSPDGDLEGPHFIFTLNHSTVPDYRPGGMQVQLWDGKQLVDSSSFGSEVLAYDQEVVVWVQRLSLEDGGLKFEVHSGESDTWGQFGGDHLALTLPTSVGSLNGYKPGLSINESQVSYAENRVVSLTLKKLVWTTDDGNVHELTAPIAVDTSLDP